MANDDKVGSLSEVSLHCCYEDQSNPGGDLP